MVDLILYCSFGGFLIFAAFSIYLLQRLKRVERGVRLHSDLTGVLELSSSALDSTPRFLELLCQAASCQAGAIFVCDTADDGMRCLNTWYSDPTLKEFCSLSKQGVYARGSGLPGLAWDCPQGLVLQGLSREQNFPRTAAGAKAGIKSVMLIPIMDNQEVLGVVELVSLKSGLLDASLLPWFLRMARRFGLLMKRVARYSDLMISELELRAVIDTAPDGLICLDGNGRIDSVNKTAMRLLGYTAEEIVGKNVVEFLPDAYKHKYGAALKFYVRTAIQNLVGKPTEVTGQRKDGSTFPVELAVARLTVGERELFTAIVRDITDRKRMEKRVSEFYSTVSHELRSPLASIRGSLGLIEGGAIGSVSPEAVELVQIAKRNCDRLIRLINDILDAKKIEAGKLQVQRQTLQPDRLLSAAVEGMQMFAAESQVCLVAQKGVGTPILGDEDRLVQVLTNLLSNAIKYSPAGAQVEIYLAPAVNGESFVRFCVRDSGPGIQSDQLAKLFSEFQQLDSSDSRPKGGTGLGLAISKSIVEQLGGQIGVDNVPGKGATFWFELPVAEPACNVAEGT